MNKHTPGPWSVDDNHGKRYIEPIYSNEPIAEICKKKGDEYTANARLIAAAPDLLEALEALADSAPSACCVDFHHKPGDYHDADESCLALDRYEAACLSARAAIARARGAE